MTRFESAMARLPLVAILRGVKLEEALGVLGALVGEGFALIEIPLNSPDPLRSIEMMRKAAPDNVLIGAGTVLDVGDVEAVKAAGGDLIVSPNADVEVIRAAKARGMVALPGVATPTEAFAALKAGADALKAFPAEMIGPNVIKAWRAVIPARVGLLPVGGVSPETMKPYIAAGANGFGLGSALYKPGDGAAAVQAKAAAFTAAWRALKG